MVFLNRFIASLLLLFPLTLDGYGARSYDESLPIPSQTIICPFSGYSVESIMKQELRRYEKNSSLTSFEMTKGGMSAELVILSPHYVARLSASPYHALEVNQFDTFVRSAKIEHAPLDIIGFKLILPLSVILVADKKDPTKKKTTASITIMERAQGRSLSTYISSRLADDVKAKMLLDLGKSLALFQTAFMREIEGQYDTAGHGDFHGRNIFGLPEKDTLIPSSQWSFSLIDCAGLELRGIHPLMDPLYFVYRMGYNLFSHNQSFDSLFSLTKSFYQGYLGHLPGDVNAALQAIPDWRKTASTELARTKNLKFFNEKLPDAPLFLSQFEILHTSAVKSVFSDLGYNRLSPFCSDAEQLDPESPIAVQGQINKLLSWIHTKNEHDIQKKKEELSSD